MILMHFLENNVQVRLAKDGKGAFVIEDNGTKQAEMVFTLSDGIMTILHTEVSDALAGKGIGKLLLGEMASFAREKGYKVIPVCPYAKLQFERNAGQYADIWYGH